MPEGISQVEIDPTTGLLATDHCLTRQLEYFIKGTEPVIPCYGNSYEQMMGGSMRSLYSSSPKAQPDKAPAPAPDKSPVSALPIKKLPQ